VLAGVASAEAFILCLSMVSSLLSSHGLSLNVHFWSLALFIKTQVLLDYSPAITTSVNPNDLFKGIISKLWSYWELGCNIQILLGTIQFITNILVISSFFLHNYQNFLIFKFDFC
jgi:hypothetical protein